MLPGPAQEFRDRPTVLSNIGMVFEAAPTGCFESRKYTCVCTVDMVQDATLANTFMHYHWLLLRGTRGARPDVHHQSCNFKISKCTCQAISTYAESTYTVTSTLYSNVSTPKPKGSLAFKSLPSRILVTLALSNVNPGLYK